MHRELRSLSGLLRFQHDRAKFRGRQFFPFTEFRRCISRNYYDSLGLTPKASQAEVKKAYYKLSLQYHPDKTEGDDEKFREITAAYEVLGNTKFRRLYDRGMLPAGGPVPDDTHSSSGPSVSSTPVTPYPFESKSKYRVPTTGRNQAYNFDDWNREHYGKAFERAQSGKRKLERSEYLKHSQNNQAEIETWIFLLGVFMVLFTVYIGITLPRKSVFDVPSKKPDPPP